jgi:hypothetical protein
MSHFRNELLGFARQTNQLILKLYTLAFSNVWFPHALTLLYRRPHPIYRISASTVLMVENLKPMTHQEESSSHSPSPIFILSQKITDLHAVMATLHPRLSTYICAQCTLRGHLPHLELTEMVLPKSRELTGCLPAVSLTRDRLAANQILGMIVVTN